MKRLVKRIVEAAGYEIRLRTESAVDAFTQQGLLLVDVSEPVIFDVGANIGLVSEKYRSSFPGASIYAFEPFPEAYGELVRRVTSDPKIWTRQAALGSATGTRRLHVNAFHATNSLLETDDSAAAFWGEGLLETTETIDVAVETLDDFCSERMISVIQILKIDTQGTELEVLRGAARMLASGRVRVIYAELTVAPSYKYQNRPSEVMAFLEGFGYHLFGLYNLWHRGDGRLLQMDAIFTIDRAPALTPGLLLPNQSPDKQFRSS